MFIHAQLEYPLYYMYFLAVFCCFFTGGLGACRAINVPLSRMASVTLPCLGGVVLLVNMYQYLAISYLYDPPVFMRGVPVSFYDIGRIERFSFNPLLRFSADLTMVKYMIVDMSALEVKYQIIDDVMKFRPNSRIIEKKINMLLLEGKDKEAAFLIRHGCRAYPRSTKVFLAGVTGHDKLKYLCQS